MSAANNNLVKRKVSYPAQQNHQSFNPKITYVKRLPFHVRHRRLLVVGGGFLSACFFFSAPIYYFFRTPPENEDPRVRMWPGEIAKGKTYAQQLRERHEENKLRAEERKAKLAEIKAKIDSSKS